MTSPLGYAVPDYGDGHILFNNRLEAEREVRGGQPGYPGDRPIIPLFPPQNRHLPLQAPCDCGRWTVMREGPVPVCNHCQQAKRKFAQTWAGQEPPTFKMDALVRAAYEHPTDVISPRRVREAHEHDVQLKRAMETMRYDDWRRLHPHTTKQELIGRE